LLFNSFGKISIQFITNKR